MKRATLFLSLVVLLASCSSSDEATEVRKGKSEAAPGGTITIAIGEPASIDPALAYERWGKLVDSLICDPLIQIDPLTGEPKPAIAESWIVGNGGRQITLKLRKGVRFHNGALLTADDVVFALSRVTSEAVGSNVAGLLRPVVGWPEMHGDVEAKTEEQTVSLAGVRVAGAGAVQISLTEPRADFYRVLSQPLASPVPRTTVTRDPTAFEAQPICAGPYMLEKPWKVGDDSISLRRFPGYYGGNSGYTRGGRGYADKVDLVIEGRSTNQSIDAVQSQGKARAGFTTITGSTPYLEYIGLPNALAPFDRREVRIALSQALDRAAIAHEVYEDVRTPAAGFMPPALGDLPRPQGCGSLTPKTGDVPTARRELAAAGVDLQNTEISLSYNPEFRNKELMEAIGRQWQAAFGVRVRLDPLPWDKHLEAALSATDGKGPFRMGWELPYPGPDAALAPLFASSGIGRDNFVRFSDVRFDRVLDRQARRAATTEDLAHQYERLEDIVCEQMPVIPVVFGGVRYDIRTDRIDSASGTYTDISSGSLAVREIYVRSQ